MEDLFNIGAFCYLEVRSVGLWKVCKCFNFALFVGTGALIEANKEGYRMIIGKIGDCEWVWQYLDLNKSGFGEIYLMPVPYSLIYIRYLLQ